MSAPAGAPEKGAGGAGAPTPSETYWAALGEGRLTFQRCEECDDAWLPPRTECPKCWSAHWRWDEASGRAKVVSWVVYHTAFDKRFQDRLPYNVAVVELEEGPRLVSNLLRISPDGGDFVDRQVSLVIEEDHGRKLPRFQLSGDDRD